MNRFGEIADELTDLIEELERSDLAAEGGSLKAALMRAFARACEAERSVRLRTESEPPKEKRRARAPRPASAEAEPVRSAVIIKLPLAWRRRRAATIARRLND